MTSNRVLTALAVAVFAALAVPAWAMGSTGVIRKVSHRPRRRKTVWDVPKSCPGADLMPTEQDLSSVRAATLCLVNRERALRDESPLAANGRLELTAQGHSDDMATGRYFKHVGPGGDTPLSRMRAVGFVASSRTGYEVGENIGWGTLWLATPRAIVATWMASPGHRANILDARFRDTAVGVAPEAPYSLAHGQAGAIYTQDFGGYLGGSDGSTVWARGRSSPTSVPATRSVRDRCRSCLSAAARARARRRHRRVGAARVRPRAARVRPRQATPDVIEIPG